MTIEIILGFVIGFVIVFSARVYLRKYFRRKYPDSKLVRVIFSDWEEAVKNAHSLK